jgi:hypothetical protein
MSNGYWLVDANTLAFAYRAGGPELLDLYADIAEEQGRKLAVTEIVRQEIKKGPLGKELLEYIAAKDIPALPTPETEKLLRSGSIPRVSSGEVSMLEIAEKEYAQGRTTRIWADDKYFDSPQIMRKKPGAQRIMSAALLDEVYDQEFIDAEDYARFRDGYQKQGAFIDSARLNSFRHTFQSLTLDVVGLHQSSVTDRAVTAEAAQVTHTPAPSVERAPGTFGDLGSQPAPAVSTIAREGADIAPEPAGLRAAHIRGAATGAALYAATEAYAWNETRERAQVFRDTLRNDTAAMDAYVQQGAQTTGALVGTAAGGATAVALGAGTGGTALLVAGEGYLFGKAAERGVELWQQHGVYNISSEGADWAFNGRQWIRDDLRADLVDDARDLPQQQNFAALPDKARELSAMASIVAVERALGQVPTPRDPFVQPAGDGGEPWRYRADRGAWAREVVTAYDINNQPSARDTVDANGAQAARLSAEALRTIDRNLAAGPAEIAARYQQGHKAHGYDQSPSGAMPEAVTTALNPDLLQASDGRHYRRDAQGAWTHDGKTADPTRALELELTRDRLLPALEDHRQQLDRMPTWQPPTPEMQDKAMLREAYRHHGIDRETRQEYFDASYLAVQRTRAETGVTAATTSLVLGPDESGRFTPDSPIHHLRMDADGAVRIAAITTPEDIARALSDVRARDRSEHIAPTDDAAIRVRAPIEQAEPAGREQRAPLINAPEHPDARMYQSILHHVQTEDHRRGREPDDISERLAAGLTADAKARGLQTVGFFRMSDDGTRAYMADTPDPSTPWARTAASDIAAAVRQGLQASSEKVADINLQQGMHPAQQQGIQAQEAARPRMA